MKNYFIDTDILINFANGHDQSLTGLLESQDKKEIVLFINPVVLAEFFTDQKLKNPNKYEKAVEFFRLFSIVDLDKKIGLEAGKLLREGKTSFLGDAMIAATCLVKNLFLLTGNNRHFRKIEKLKIYKLPELPPRG